MTRKFCESCGDRIRGRVVTAPDETAPNGETYYCEGCAECDIGGCERKGCTNVWAQNAGGEERLWLCQQCFNSWRRRGAHERHKSDCEVEQATGQSGGGGGVTDRGLSGADVDTAELAGMLRDLADDIDDDAAAVKRVTTAETVDNHSYAVTTLLVRFARTEDAADYEIDYDLERLGGDEGDA